MVSARTHFLIKHSAKITSPIVRNYRRIASPGMRDEILLFSALTWCKKWQFSTIKYDHMLSRFHLIPERYGRTDRQILCINIARQYDKNSRVCRIHMSKPTVQQYRRCCHLGNGNKTSRSLLLFKNNNVARGSQGLYAKVHETWHYV